MTSDPFPAAILVIAFASGIVVTMLLSAMTARQVSRGIRQAIYDHLAYARDLDDRRESADHTAARARSRETAYQALMGWLFDVERVIDEIYFGSCSDDEADLARAKLAIDQWPWETLRPPRDVAAVSFHWSERVRERIRDMAGESSTFILRSNVLLRRNLKGDQGSATSTDLWELRGSLLRVVDQIRIAVREDIDEGSPRGRC